MHAQAPKNSPDGYNRYIYEATGLSEISRVDISKDDGDIAYLSREILVSDSTQHELGMAVGRREDVVARQQRLQFYRYMVVQKTYEPLSPDEPLRQLLMQGYGNSAKTALLLKEKIDPSRVYISSLETMTPEELKAMKLRWWLLQRQRNQNSV